MIYDQPPSITAIHFSLIVYDTKSILYFVKYGIALLLIQIPSLKKKNL